MSILLKLTLLLTVFATPLVGSVWNLGFEEAKVLFFITTTTAAGLIWVKSGLYKKNRWGKIQILALIFIAVLGISSITGVDTKVSFFGRQPYFQGWILHAYLFLFFLMLVTIKIGFRWWAGILSFSASLVSFLAVYDWIMLHLLGADVPTYAGRVVASFGQPNFLAGFILLVLPFTYALLRSRNRLFIILSVLGILLEILAILASGSKIAAGLLVALFLGGLVVSLPAVTRKVMATVTALVILSSLFSSWYFSSGILWEELGKPWRPAWFAHEFPDRGFFLWQLRWSDHPEKRIYIWPVVGDLVFKRPILGYGLENLPVVFATSKLAQFHGIKDLGVDRSHNIILDLLFSSGVFGLLSWGLLAGFLFRKTKSAVLLAALFIYLVWVQVQNQSVVHLIYFWLAAALVETGDRTT